MFKKTTHKAFRHRHKLGIFAKVVDGVDVLDMPKPYTTVLVETTSGKYVIQPGGDARSQTYSGTCAKYVTGVDVYRRLCWRERFAEPVGFHDNGLCRKRTLRVLEIGKMLQTGGSEGPMYACGQIRSIVLL